MARAVEEDKRAVFFHEAAFSAPLWVEALRCKPCPVSLQFSHVHVLRRCHSRFSLAQDPHLPSCGVVDGLPSQRQWRRSSPRRRRASPADLTVPTFWIERGLALETARRVWMEVESVEWSEGGRRLGSVVVVVVLPMSRSSSKLLARA